jgi:hypothetical protein
MGSTAKSVALLSMLVSACFVHAQTDSSLVAQYHCDEGSGSLLHDSGPFGNHITLNNASWAAGENGSGLVFNGTNSYGSTATPPGASLDFGSGDFSIALWMNTTSLSNAGHKENILSKGDPFNTGVTLAIEHGITWACVGNTGTSGFSYAVKPVNDGLWHLFACVRKSGVVLMYNDTQLVYSYAFSGNLTVTSPLYLGRHGTLAQEFYNGKLDEITMYKRALSSSEINALYFRKGVIATGDFLIPVPSPTYNRRPALVWRALQSAGSYDVQVDTTRYFSHPLISLATADTFFRPLADLPADSLFWQVIANVNDTFTCYSSVGSFLIQDSTVPILIPYVPKVTLQRQPTFKWHSVASAASYTIEIGSEALFVNSPFIIPVTDTQYSQTVSLNCGAVYWRVKSSLSAAWSAVDAFQIVPDSVPFLIRFDGATISTTKPQFTWYKVAGAASYTVEIANNNPFSGGYVVPQTDTSYMPSVALTNGTWFWKVSSNKNLSLFSFPDSFTIVSTKVNLPTQSGVTAARFTARSSGNKIEISANFTSNSNARMILFSMAGKIVLRRALTFSNGTAFVDAAAIPPGLYMMEIRTGTGYSGEKVFVGK